MFTVMGRSILASGGTICAMGKVEHAVHIIGTQYYEDESKYEGDWKEDKKHGNGK